MLSAYVYQEERKADVMAYAVGLAWGGKKARRRGRRDKHDTKADIDHLRKLMRGESDGTPIDLTPNVVETIFAGDIVESNKPYVPPPQTAPGENIDADREYFKQIDKVFEDYPSDRPRKGRKVTRVPKVGK